MALLIDFVPFVGSPKTWMLSSSSHIKEHMTHFEGIRMNNFVEVDFSLSVLLIKIEMKSKHSLEHHQNTRRHISLKAQNHFWCAYNASVLGSVAKTIWQGEVSNEVLVLVPRLYL